VQSEVDKGFLLGPFVYPPFPTVRINPIGIVESKYSKKKRLIVDLSAPHDLEDVCSLNDLINKEDFRLSYVRLDDAIRIIKTLHQGDPIFLCKTDIADAFKQIPLHPSTWPYHGIKWHNMYYFYTRLVFGSRSSPNIFDRFASMVSWILENNYAIKPILHLLDDFITIVPPTVDAQRQMDTMLGVFESLGIPLSARKTVGPVTCLEYLGIELSTTDMVARLPADKLDRIRGIVAQFLVIKKCRKRQLLSLLGHLQFACRVIVAGRAFTSRLLVAATSVKKLCHFVSLSSAVRLDLKMWHELLQHWNGVSLFLDVQTTNSFHMELFTDASSIGFGGYFQGAWFYGTWPDNLESRLDSDFSIAFKELYPIVIAALLYGKSWGQKRILFKCDNAAVVFAINKGRSHSAAMMQLMRRLVLIAADCNFAFAAQHLPGITNNIADALSRLQLQRFRALAPNAQTEPTPLPQQVLFA
jgi:hypothetical protein